MNLSDIADMKVKPCVLCIFGNNPNKVVEAMGIDKPIKHIRDDIKNGDVINITSKDIKTVQEKCTPMYVIHEEDLENKDVDDDTYKYIHTMKDLHVCTK